ncbi:MAG: MFS transporter [Streptosporangiales bacterium]|nr:MFS transporter [Streptosporangiales bacterium]
MLTALSLGALLNPLNSSMIAVALVAVQRSFHVGVATSSWVVSAFYVAACIGQPLAGRLIDQFGARRLFIAGLVLVFVVSVLTPFCPGFWWLVGLRVAQSLGTSTAFPAAVVVIRRSIREGDNPAAGFGALTIATSSSAALGPVLGGLLVALGGWQAVFLVNIPLTIAGVLVAWRVLPKDRAPDARGSVRETAASLDLPGVALFALTMTALLLFVLSFGTTPRWWYAPVFAVALVAFVLRERSARTPFIDLRGVVGNRALSSVLLQQGAINLAFYCIFFGMPLWLESVRGLGTGLAGLLMLPITAVSTLATPLCARLIAQRGSRTALLLGGIVLVAASLLLQLLGDATPLAIVVVFGLLLGVPNGFNNLGLQTALYEAAPPEQTGTASGIFQMFRYLGAISSTAVIGVVFEENLTSGGLHRIGYVMTIAAVVVLALALVRRSRRGRAAAKPS